MFLNESIIVMRCDFSVYILKGQPKLLGVGHNKCLTNYWSKKRKTLACSWCCCCCFFASKPKFFHYLEHFHPASFGRLSFGVLWAWETQSEKHGKAKVSAAFGSSSNIEGNKKEEKRLKKSRPNSYTASHTTTPYVLQNTIHCRVYRFACVPMFIAFNANAKAQSGIFGEQKKCKTWVGLYGIAKEVLYIHGLMLINK